MAVGIGSCWWAPIARFKDLGDEELRNVLEHLMSSLNGQLEQRQLRIDLSSALQESLIKTSLHEGMGARSIQRLFDRRVRDVIAEHLFEEAIESGAYTLDLDTGEDVIVLAAA